MDITFRVFEYQHIEKDVKINQKANGVFSHEVNIAVNILTNLVKDVIDLSKFQLDVTERSSCVGNMTYEVVARDSKFGAVMQAFISMDF